MGETMRLHATAVPLDDKGILIIGASGSRKSTLALQLMALGCRLVADDQTELTRRDDVLWASAPPSIRGLIEARGVGILQVEPTEAAIAVVIDLDRTEHDRLPQRHVATYLGHARPCLRKVPGPAWPAAILQYIRAERTEPS